MSQALCMPVKSRPELQELLQRHGVGVTAQRLTIAGLLFAGPRHVSAEQLLVELRHCGQHVSKATVYNTLGLFSKVGLLREVIADPDRVFYDSNTSTHQHLYDPVSATLTDIQSADIDIRVLPQIPAGMEIEAIDIVVRLRPGDS